MRAMRIESIRAPLRLAKTSVPLPTRSQLLIRVHACGVCRTDLHIVDGDLPAPQLPRVPGHEIVGIVADAGADVDDFRIGDRVGVPWLASTCGRCRHCIAGRENLCDDARFTGYSADGGYAEYAAAEAAYCFRLPDGPSDPEIAPWLCAGLIGHRALRMAGDASAIGVYGFGAAAHIVSQVARYQGRDVFAFTRPGDTATQARARALGVKWAGGSDERAPVELDAALLFAPIGALVPKALRDVGKGGSVVCAGIHMSEIPAFPYEILWGERRVLSVANLTRQDGEAFLALAPSVPIRANVVTFPLERANAALAGLRDGTLDGTAVLTMR
jgi:alcohol dehydrogenase, propanol-preferring